MMASAGVAAALALTGVPAYASPTGCGPDGVTVVVDPGPLGGGTAAGCVAEGGGLTAAEIVQRAGFEIEYAQGQPFVCRVDGAPGPRQESCARTPPADAYWGLFWSDSGPAAWSYSTLGAAALEVPGGGAVGLRFQDGGEREEPGAVADAGRPTRGTAEGPEGTAPTLTLVAGAAVVVLVVAAGAVAWRRRG